MQAQFGRLAKKFAAGKLFIYKPREALPEIREQAVHVGGVILEHQPQHRHVQAAGVHHALGYNGGLVAGVLHSAVEMFLVLRYTVDIDFQKQPLDVPIITC